MAQRTASTTLRNSTSAPSPVRLITRPWCTAMMGSIRSLRSARTSPMYDLHPRSRAGYIRPHPQLELRLAYDSRSRVRLLIFTIAGRPNQEGTFATDSHAEPIWPPAATGPSRSLDAQLHCRLPADGYGFMLVNT